MAGRVAEQVRMICGGTYFVASVDGTFYSFLAVHSVRALSDHIEDGVLLECVRTLVT